MPGSATAAVEREYVYPELSVVPKASEQILNQSLKEKNGSIGNHLPLLVPASMTFLAGLVEQISGARVDLSRPNSANQYAPWVGMGVGAAWWAVSLGILNRLEIHESASKEVASLPTGTQRDQLLKERRAEEAIDKAGAIARRMKWISFGSNLLASGFMAGTAKDGNASLYFALASAATSFAPILFPHSWESLEDQHRDYKKRIYAPVAGITFLKDPRSSIALTPGFSVSLNF